MRTNDVLLLGGVGVVAWIFWQKASAASNIIILPGSVSNISLDGIGGNPVIDITLIIQNTSSSGFTIQSLAGNLFSDGTLIGNVSSFNATTVPANAQVSMPVSVRLMPLGLINQIFQAINVGNIKKTLKLTGFVNAGFARAPIDVNFSIGG